MSKKRKEETLKRVEVSAAKGRPMLSWVGKRPLRYVPVLPAQHVESYDPSGDLAKIKPRTTWLDWPEEYPKSGLLFHGDNKEVLAHLLANGFRGRVNLIYIDPPFDSGADYVRKVTLRGVKGVSKVEGESYKLDEQIQYTDIWANDNYLQFMYERLTLLKELLSESGCIWLHCDHRKVHHLRLLLDEVFGQNGYLNTISWRSQVARGAKVNAFYFPYSTHYLEVYAKNKEYPTTWNPVKKETIINESEATRKYMRDDKGYFRTSDPGSYSFESLKALHEEGRLYAPYGGKVIINESAKRVTCSNGGNLGVKYYIKDIGGGKYLIERAVDNLWDDVPGLGTTPGEDTGYPTQKTEALLRRIITVSSNPGDIILDAFIGSGTTAAVAQKLGRRWIGCDINKGAIQTTAKRLQKVIGEQNESGGTPSKRGAEANSEPTQLSLCVFRVNDYDLQVQHNEAVKLACDYIGVETSRSDAYFDGTLGKALVKIVPFNHPLSPMDLEDLKRELEARKDEDRDIVLVCLGMELAAHVWVDEWNRLRRKGGGVPNRLRVIELRTDPNYAGFIKHDPATARVEIKRTKGRIAVKIEDFVSPTIIKRLDMEQDIFQKKIKDWRSMVDCVMIDPDYDGKVFSVALSDVPAKKDNLVSGEYEFAVPAGKEKITVAVKVIDMLGEEVLVTKDV